MNATIQTLTQVLGYLSDADMAEQVHQISHHGVVEHISLGRDDTLRRRLRARTDAGTDCQIALPREQHLSDGAVLLLEDKRAIVVRMREERWLLLTPRDAASALQLGYFAGNLHWRVRFNNERLAIALEGPEADYLARLQDFLNDGRVSLVAGGDAD